MLASAIWPSVNAPLNAEPRELRGRASLLLLLLLLRQPWMLLLLKGMPTLHVMATRVVLADDAPYLWAVPPKCPSVAVAGCDCCPCATDQSP